MGRELFTAFDRNNDGDIEIEEFISFCVTGADEYKKLHPQSPKKGKSLLKSKDKTEEVNVKSEMKKAGVSRKVRRILSVKVSKLKIDGEKGIDALDKLFEEYDNSGDGSIQLSEFKEAMDDLSLGLNRKQIKDLFNHFDQDGSGDINIEEFLDFVDDFDSSLTVE